MVRYLFTADLTPEAFRGLVKNPQDRKDVVAPLFRKLEGDIEHYWFGVGSSTIYVVITTSDSDVDLEALLMVVMSSGIAHSCNMVKLMASKDAVESMRRASELSYTAPDG